MCVFEEETAGELSIMCSPQREEKQTSVSYLQPRSLRMEIPHGVGPGGGLWLFLTQASSSAAEQPLSPKSAERWLPSAVMGRLHGVFM